MGDGKFNQINCSTVMKDLQVVENGMVMSYIQWKESYSERDNNA